MANNTPYKLDDIINKYCGGDKPTFECKEFRFWRKDWVIVIEIEKSIFCNHLMSKRKVFYDYDIYGKSKLDIHLIRGNVVEVFCGLNETNSYFNLGKGYIEKHAHKPTEIILDRKISDETWHQIGWSDEELQELKFNGFSLPNDLIRIIVEDEFLKLEDTKGFNQQFPIGFREIYDLTNDIIRLYNDSKHKDDFGLDSSVDKGIEIPSNLLDINQMVCIGDVDFEVIVCLDMRTLKENPQIIALTWATEKWELVAENICDFKEKVNANGLDYFIKKIKPSS